VDEGVVDLLTTKGLVLKIDVDEQRELAQKYAVRAMPTLIAMRDGEVFDRVLGARSPEQMIEWFEGVQRGERSIDVQRRQLEARKPGEHDVQGRFQFAQALMDSREFDEATKHMLWLWDHAVEHDPSFSAVRASFMLSSIEQLCGNHPPAAEAFGERRDDAERKMAEGAADPGLARDFAGLNDALGQGERTLAWFDAGKDDASKTPLFEAASMWLTPLLLEGERWADAGRMLPNPVEQAQVSLPMQLQMMQETSDLEEEVKTMFLNQLATEHALQHAALLAAGREREAIRMAMLVANQLGTRGRIELARAALRAKVVQPIHLRLINAIEVDQPADFVELQAKLEAALAERGAD
jgi:hypothetical protein